MSALFRLLVTSLVLHCLHPPCTASKKTSLASSHYSLNKIFLQTQDAFNATSLIKSTYNHLFPSFLPPSPRTTIRKRNTFSIPPAQQHLQQFPAHLHAWIRWFVNRMKHLLKTGRGDKVCIIKATKRREKCCKRVVVGSLERKTRKWALKKVKKEWKYWVGLLVEFCMELTENYFERLEEKGLKLVERDEEMLQGMLEDVVGERGVGRSVKRRKKKKRKKKVGGKKKDGMGMLKDYLRVMKVVEGMGKDYLEEERRVGRMYRRFRRGFRKLYVEKKTGVFFHGVDSVWVACGLVRYEEEVCVYCARLDAVDRRARELGRGPILGWESGKSIVEEEEGEEEGEGVGYVVRDSDSSSGSDSGSESDSDSDGGSGSYFVFVDLLGSTSSRCPSANLGYACHALCCDTVFTFSFICQYLFVSCIGD